MTNPSPPPEQAAEQLLYARLLGWTTGAGLILLLLGFAAYVCGWVEAQVAPQRLPELWSQPVGRYLELSGTPAGWGWLALLRHSDIASLLGVAVLTGSSALCLLALVPGYLRRRDHAYAALCLAQAGLIALAASGWLVGAR